MVNFIKTSVLALRFIDIFNQFFLLCFRNGSFGGTKISCSQRLAAVVATMLQVAMLLVVLYLLHDSS